MPLRFAKGRGLPVENIARHLNDPLRNYVGRGTEGDLYGLELELEGRNVAMGGRAIKGWTQDKDGSLRGESIEYVFSKPCEYKEAIDRVDRLFKAFKEEGVQIKNSYRTSTHVHVNFADKKVRQAVNFFCLFTMIEELLTNYCGEGRSGNLFCLSTRDVEPIVDMLKDSIKSGQAFAAFGNELRYCACNLSALNKFGSIEIRTMRGADGADMVKDWLEVIHQMYDYACNKMKAPTELIENLSHLGPDRWLEQIFNRETLNKLMDAWGWELNLRESLYRGARLIQLLAYDLDEAYKTEVAEVKRDPFGQAQGNPRERRRQDVDYPFQVGWALGLAIPIYDIGAPNIRKVMRITRPRDGRTLGVSNTRTPYYVPGWAERLVYIPDHDFFVDRERGDVWYWEDEYLEDYRPLVEGDDDDDFDEEDED